MAFELEAVFRLGVLQCRLELRGDGLNAVRVEIVEEVAFQTFRVAFATAAGRGVSE